MGRTITLDEDVAALLEKVSEKSGRSVEELANDILRQEQPRKRFIVQPFDMGAPLIDLECTSRALAKLDELEHAIKE